MSETMYVVRQKPCGCLVSSKPVKDQGAVAVVVGTRYEHPDKTVSTVLSLSVAASVPEKRKEHRNG